MEEHTHELRVVVFRDNEKWIAQCVEFDIGAQGETFDDVATRFALAIGADFQESMQRHGKPFGGIDPAPRWYAELWEGRARTVPPIQSIQTEGSDAPPYQMALVA